MQSIWTSFRQTTRTTQLVIAMALSSYLWNGLILGFISNGTDFDLVYKASRLLLHKQGFAIYTDFLNYLVGQDSLMYMYPPAVAMLYSPLALFSRATAFLLFQFFWHAVLGASLYLLLKDPQQRAQSLESKLTVVSLWLLFYPLYYGLAMGQSEPFVLLMILLSLHLFKENKCALSSLFLVIAIWLKVFVGFLLIYWLLRKQWKYVLYAAGWGLGWVLLTLRFVPWDIQMTVATKLIGSIGIEAFIDNHSLTGLLFRNLTVNYFTHGWIHSPTLAQGLLRLIQGFIVYEFARLVWKGATRISLEQGISFAMVTLLILAPHTDTHHLALLLLPFSWMWLSNEWDEKTSLIFCFFAILIPIVGFKFIAFDRALWITRHSFSQWLISIPSVVLLAFWIDLRQKLQICLK